MNGNLIWAILTTIALAACAPSSGLGSGNAAASADAIALKSTTALSLAELAYNSGEAAATAAIKSGALTRAQDDAIGGAMHRARAWRDEARTIASSGGDASAALESLDETLEEIDTLATPAGR